MIDGTATEGRWNANIYLSRGVVESVNCTGRIIDATESKTAIAVLTVEELEDLRQRASNYAIATLIAGVIGFLIGKFWP